MTNNIKQDTARTASRWTRRDFLPGAAAFTIVPRHVLGAPFVPPSDKLNIAGVGVGAMGGVYLRSCETENIVALADVDHEYASKTIARYPKAARYRDFRQMLEKEIGIDAVVIGTPDHTHAVVASAAFKARKHVYCAKPMARTVFECRHLAKAAREAGVATQMSTQSIASEQSCSIEELIQSGAIGHVREVHVWTDRPVWPQGLERPTDIPPVPANLAWDLWLGPAPARPYHSLYHPFCWRGWYDFGTGALGDMALHSFHNVFRALKLQAPTSVSASVSFTCLPSPPLKGGPGIPPLKHAPHPETYPNSEIVAWHFAPRGDLPAVRLIWYDGGLRPPRPAELPLDREMGKQGPTTSATRASSIMMGSQPEIAPGRRCFFPRKNFATLCLRPRPFPERSDTTRSGFRQQKAVRLPTATLISPASLPRQL